MSASPALPAIELQAPDISRWRQSNTGVEYVHSFDSGRPGRHVMVQALTHGNELCGAIALNWLLGQGQPITPARGRLTLSFANVAAYARWNPEQPDASRFVDEDLNRVWADEVLLGSGSSLELQRARELRPFVDSADFLLDIHSMREACKPLMVCGDANRGGHKAVAFTQQLKVPEVLMVDTGHAAGLRMIDRGAFGDPKNARTAVLIECGQHWERQAAGVALDALLRFLRYAGAVSEAFAKENLASLQLTPPREQVLVQVEHAVTVRTQAFKWTKTYQGLEVVPKAGTVIAMDGDEPVATQFDDAVLVMPSATAPPSGRTAVRIGRLTRLGQSDAA